MRTPPRVFFRHFDPTNYSAHDYYRIEIPARILGTMGVETTRDTELFCRTENDFAAHFLAVSNHDVYHCFSTGGPAIESIQHMLRFLPPIDAETPPPLWITDIDDNLDYIHPINPSFRKLGTRLHDGTLLHKLLRLPPEEQVINILLEGTGEELPLYTNGKDGFDILSNWKGLCSLNRIARQAHGVTVPTRRLAAYYAKKLRHSNVYAFPNSVIFEDYPKIHLAKKPGKIRVMWHGGASHYPDFFPMAATFKAAAERFPEIEWVIWGADFRWLGKAIPESRIERHEWVPYEAFRIKLAALDFDIAVIPLIQGPFNQGKSNIKWYEVSALAEPKPAIAANVPPYSDEIQDGETGMLFRMPTRADEISETFMSKLEALVRDGALRDRLAANAKDWIAENVAASVTVPRWWEWVKETHERYRQAKLHLDPAGVNAGLPLGERAGDLREDVRSDLSGA